jgi:hypothetical protein
MGWLNGGWRDQMAASLGNDEKAIAILVTLEVTAKTSRI